MTPYRTSSGPTWKVRVVGRSGAARVSSTGTADRATADDVEAMVKRFRQRRQWAPLDAIVAGRFTLAEVYDAEVDGTLKELLATLDAADLDPLIDEWARSGANAKYVTQVRRLIPAGTVFPASRFTRAAVRTFLDELTRRHRMVEGGDTGEPASNSTKNRHRAALSVFAAWLIERGVLETNPVRDVKARPSPRLRIRYLTPHQQQALVRALPPGQQQVLEAFMAGTGVELGALLNARRRDVDLEERTLYCFPGDGLADGKTRYRERVVEVTEDWAWPILEPHLAALPANARLFTLDGGEAHRVHDRVVKALGLPPVTIHQWRNSYAVMALKRGDDPADIRRQLGHAPNSTLLFTRYGVYTTRPKGRRRREQEQAP